MITEKQIQEYIFNRDESEYENLRIYNTGGSHWRTLTPSQKRAEARRQLEYQAHMDELYGRM